MPCEMCGKAGPTLLAEIEGSELRVCPECAKLGTIITREKKKKAQQVKVENVLELRKKRMTPRDVLTKTEWELIADYGKTILKARQKMNLTQKELAEKLNERKSTMAKLESEEFYPDPKLIGKLEHFLHIKLKESVVAAPLMRTSSGGGLTLGDLIKMKKK